MSPEDILHKFDIQEKDVVAIYPYGSRVYGCHNDSSDHDWVIVYKASMLPSGAFRDNAISSEDRSHQAICYSRSGFQSAIDYYDVTALECALLPKEMVIMSKMNFGVRKWVASEMASSFITKASSSWHLALEAMKRDDEQKARKNVYHALRILGFGLQLAETGKILEYGAYNHLRKNVMEDPEFSTNKYMGMRDNFMHTLRSKTV